MGNKMKTHKAAAKRITLTGTGKLKRRKVGLVHLQTKRSSGSQMRNNNGAQSVAKCDVKKMSPLIGK